MTALANHPALCAHPEQQYLDLLRELIAAPARETRNDTATHSVFGRTMRFDLADGFPLLTTKRVFWRGVVAELLWFLSGSTNAKVLEDQGVEIWRKWGDPETREMGPIYGHQLRAAGAKPGAIPRRTPRLRQGIPATVFGVAHGSGSSTHPLGPTWAGMIDRCYDPTNTSYKHYGERGVTVCDRWLEFAAFAEDAENLPGWHRKVLSFDRFVLDKDILGNGFEYSPESCMWITDAENAWATSSHVCTVRRAGIDYTFTNVSEFCREMGAEAKNFSDLWTGNKNAQVRSGFTLVDRAPLNRGIDQVAEVLQGLRDDPYGRRHVMTLWNPADLPDMALPPCHGIAIQFYVGADERLSLFMHQRSGDVFLGVPFNIASYALLLTMFASVLGREPGEFVHSIGDAHLYSNHVDQAREQISRAPRPFPKLDVMQRHSDMDHWRSEDFFLRGYDPHPAIKAEASA